MSDTHEIIDAITAFYREVIRHPYLDEAALKIPPASGWDTIDTDSLRRIGKNDAVIELLQHLPYLETDGEYDRLLVEYDTVPIAYTQRTDTVVEQVIPLPGHCVYLTEGVDREGYSLILDIQRGTITAYSISGYEITLDAQQDYDGLPQSEQWKAHRTLPAVELLNIWSSKLARLVNMLVPNRIRAPTTGRFYSRMTTWADGEQLAQETGPFEEWHPDMQDLTSRVEDESLRRYRYASLQHTADIYNCFLRHGWPDAFNKDACKVEVIRLEKQMDAEEKRFMDANNPDAALFDD